MWFQRQQQTEIAEEYSRRSRQLRERCLEQFPLAADPYHSLSWYLSMCPMLEQHETDLAIRLARRALEYEPDNGTHWQVLGCAYYRDGQWQECLEAFEKAIEQNQSVSGLDALMLASAHAGVGHAETATQWFERAQRSKASHCWNQHLLQRLQAEASQLIASQLSKP